LNCGQFAIACPNFSNSHIASEPATETAIGEPRRIGIVSCAENAMNEKLQIMFGAWKRSWIAELKQHLPSLAQRLRLGLMEKFTLEIETSADWVTFHSIMRPGEDYLKRTS
jgi:hypothetical protein